MNWDDMDAPLQLAWTQAFLDYPPVFLGVIGMLATQAGALAGKPTRHRSWRDDASAWHAAGFSPHLYLCLRGLLADDLRRRQLLPAAARLVFSDDAHRRLRPEQWSGFVTLMNGGLRASAACERHLGSITREALAQPTDAAWQ